MHGLARLAHRDGTQVLQITMKLYFLPSIFYAIHVQYMYFYNASSESD